MQVTLRRIEVGRVFLADLMAVLGTHRSIVDGKRGQGWQTVRRGLRRGGRGDLTCDKDHRSSATDYGAAQGGQSRGA